MESRDIMTLAQMPIIKQQLQELSNEIEEKLKNVDTLVVTEENYKTIKSIRASFNKEFQELEERRKEIKEQLLEPYMQFENEYKKLIANKYKLADLSLRTKINECEDVLKKQKEQEIIEYFNELVASKHLQDVIRFEDLDISIGLSDTQNKLRKMVSEKIEKIDTDITMIWNEEHAALILNEYYKCWDYAQAKLTALNIIRAEKANQERLEKRAKEQEKEQAIVETVEKVVDNSPDGVRLKGRETQAIIQIPAIVVPAEQIKITQNILTTKFVVKGTKEQLIALREFMNENNMEFYNE